MCYTRPSINMKNEITIKSIVKVSGGRGRDVSNILRVVVGGWFFFSWYMVWGIYFLDEGEMV